MKKLLILLPILVIASYTAGCIFSDNIGKADSDPKTLRSKTAHNIFVKSESNGFALVALGG